MRILILNWRDPWHPKAGGAEFVTMEHAKRWVAAGHETVWFTAAYHGALSAETRDGVRFVRSVGPLSVHAAAIPYLIRNGSRFDVIIDEIHGIPFFAPLWTRTPVVAFIHEVAGEIWDRMYPFPINILGKTVERLYFFLYRGTPFWTDAPSMARELARYGVSPSRCIAIPCPVPDSGTIPQSPASGKEAQPTFVFVSRIVPMKGIEHVLTAFNGISRDLPDAKLWIIGSGDPPYVTHLKSRAAGMGIDGRVVWWGRVTDSEKYRLLGRSHILLHASVREGWGLVVLEAAVAGTPSVVYNVTGLCDVVKDGETGIVLPNNTPGDMAREAVALYRDTGRYQRFRKNGIAWAGSLSWDDVARQSMQLLKRTVSG